MQVVEIDQVNVSEFIPLRHSRYIDFVFVELVEKGTDHIAYIGFIIRRNYDQVFLFFIQDIGHVNRHTVVHDHFLEHQVFQVRLFGDSLKKFVFQGAIDLSILSIDIPGD